MHFFALSRSGSQLGIVSSIKHLISRPIRSCQSKLRDTPEDFDRVSGAVAMPLKVEREYSHSTSSTKSLSTKDSPSHLSSKDRCVQSSAFESASPTLTVSPLRLRVFNNGGGNVPKNCAGRIVIVGRMEDVCEEIDRLAKISDNKT
jgi:hypothetical protein